MDKLEQIAAAKKAPLVEVDRDELGDKRLDPKEGVAKLREECLKDASRYKIDGQDELADPERAYGPKLQFTEIISRLRRLNNQLKFLDGSPGNIAVYYPRTREEVETTIREWDIDKVVHATSKGHERFFQHHKYVTGFPKTWLSEWSTVDLDTSFLPTREHRGYRSALIGLIRQGILTYNEAIKEFGDPCTDRRAWMWRDKLSEWMKRPNHRFTPASAEAGHNQGETNE